MGTEEAVVTILFICIPVLGLGWLLAWSLQAAIREIRDIWHETDDKERGPDDGG